MTTTNRHEHPQIQIRGAHAFGVLAIGAVPLRSFIHLRHVSISLCVPMSAHWAAANVRKKFPHFCIGGVRWKIFLKAWSVAKEEIRGPLVNDMPRKKVERGVDVAEALAVDEPILPLSAVSLGLFKKPPEVLARCFPIPRLVSATDDHV